MVILSGSFTFFRLDLLRVRPSLPVTMYFRNIPQSNCQKESARRCRQTLLSPLGFIAACQPAKALLEKILFDK
jgi:hypothetical protein